jgi:TOBE domain
VKTLLGNLLLDPAATALGTEGQVTVLIRPEQIELGAADGLAGRVTSYGYHGHDAVVHVRPDHTPDPCTIVVRLSGAHYLPPGSPVTLQARGPVFAWPRD